MDKARRRFLMAAFAIGTSASSLASCTTKFSTQVPRGSIKSVAIFSELPNRLSLSYVGFTVFDNRRVYVDGDFGFNDLILADMRTSLATRYQIVPLTLRKLAPDKASSEDDQVRKTGERLRAIAKPGEVDAIILGAPMFGVQGDEPLAAFWGSQMTEPRNTAGVSWVLEVFDGGTFERIAYSHIMPSPFVDLRWSGEPYDRLPNQERAQLQGILERSVKGSIPLKLKECGLLS